LGEGNCRDDVTLLRLRTPARAESIQVARRAGGALEALHRSDDLGSRVALVLTELATNAVRHSSGQTIEVELTLSPDRLTGFVRDDGQGFVPSTPGLPRAEATGGRGLYLLEALTDEWHLDTSDGTRVSFAFALNGGEADEPLSRSADEPAAARTPGQATSKKR
jgi:anti-sigma regulatory factor (Ser/Thr protein kinase)